MWTFCGAACYESEFTFLIFSLEPQQHSIWQIHVTKTIWYHVMWFKWDVAVLLTSIIYVIIHVWLYNAHLCRLSWSGSPPLILVWPMSGCSPAPSASWFWSTCSTHLWPVCIYSEILPLTLCQIILTDTFRSSLALLLVFTSCYRSYMYQSNIDMLTLFKNQTLLIFSPAAECSRFLSQTRMWCTGTGTDTSSSLTFPWTRQRSFWATAHL